MFGDFTLIDGSGAGSRFLTRLPLGDTGGRDEAWLRDKLFEHPGLIPVGELDPSCGPLLPLCRELRTEAGPIDVAYINPTGRLTLVECKLWRNPEARRKVVVQILDYARALVRWSYSDLQRQVAMASGSRGPTPFELARTANPALVEHQFVDAVTRNLRGGRFLLVIAGDGIREDVVALTELIGRNSTLGYSFGLVELALYDCAPEGILVQPRVPMRSHVVERNVMVLAGGDTLVDADRDGSDPDLEEPRADSTAAIGRHAGYRQWWEPVLAMSFDDPDQPSPRLHWPNHVRVQLPWPKVWLTAWHGDAQSGTAGIFLAGQEAERDRLLTLLEPLAELVTSLPDGTIADNLDS